MFFFLKRPSLFQIDEKEVTMIKTHLRQEEEQAYLAGDRRRSMSSRRSSLSSQHSRLQVPNDTQATKLDRFTSQTQIILLFVNTL